MTKIKNATSAGANTFKKIQDILARHNATKILFEYVVPHNGQIAGITFCVDINGREFSVRLPARVGNVALIMYGAPLDRLSEKQRQQAYNTAWANIRDWIDAQMAMVDTDMVQTAEVFMPYLIAKNGNTFFEHLSQNPQLLLS